jgi:hypothetical protein
MSGSKESVARFFNPAQARHAPIVAQVPFANRALQQPVNLPESFEFSRSGWVDRTRHSGQFSVRWTTRPENGT